MIKNTQLEKPEDSDEESQMGRPQKPIDWNLFEQLCAIQCTQYEIASMLKINVDTLHDRSLEYYKCTTYSEVYKKFSESGKCSLRRNQFVLSKTNAAMAIWLGKQWLGQKEPEKLVDILLEETAKVQMETLVKKLSEMQSQASSERKMACSNNISDKSSDAVTKE